MFAGYRRLEILGFLLLVAIPPPSTLIYSLYSNLVSISKTPNLSSCCSVLCFPIHLCNLLWNHNTRLLILTLVSTFGFAMALVLFICGIVHFPFMPAAGSNSQNIKIPAAIARHSRSAYTLPLHMLPPPP
jgi:hypothetical protein